MSEGGEPSTKAVLRTIRKTPRNIVGSVKEFFEKRTRRAEAIAASRHMNVDTKLKLLSSMHRQMNLLSSFIMAMVFGLLGGILLWAVFQNMTAMVLGWAILVFILFETIVTVQDRSFKAAIGK
jgi:hypothetical protein